MRLLSLFQSSQPVVTDQLSELASQRERIITNMLRVMSVLGFVLLLAYAGFAIPQGRWLTFVAFLGVYAWTLTITLARRLPYALRLYGLLGLIYFLGLVVFLQDGLQGNGRLYLLTFTVMAGILMGLRGGVIALLLSLLTVFAGYLLMSNGTLPQASLDTSTRNGVYWLLGGVQLLALGGATVISMVTLVRSLERSLAQQRALAGELEKERGLLEKNVAERTRDLARRLTQIRTAAEISQAISAVLNIDELLQKIVVLIRERFEMDYAAAYLADELGATAELRAGTGEAGQALLAQGHRLPVGGASLVGLVMANREPRAVLDIFPGEEKPGVSYLPSSRTEVALPLLSGDKVIGAITVQSTRPNAFDKDDITVLQGIVDSLAIALENARLFQQVQRTIEEVRALNRQYLLQSWTDIPHTPEYLSYTFENASAAALAATTPSTPEQPTSVLEMPIKLRDQPIGKIALEASRSDWQPDDAAFVEAVMTQAGLALENARLLEETQRRAAQERFVAEVARKMRSATDVEAILRTAILELGRTLRASEGIIQINVGDGDRASQREVRE